MQESTHSHGRRHRAGVRHRNHSLVVAAAITPAPFGAGGRRVWRRLHGGVPNSTAYQMWPSAVGLQPQDNVFFVHTSPWLGFRIGHIGSPQPRFTG